VRPYLKKKKKKSQTRAGRMAQVVNPEFKPQHHKKRKKEERKEKRSQV
jgi:hypothetical protein